MRALQITSIFQPGIGAVAAEYFAKEGALLALVGRNAEKFEKVLANIKANDIETEPLIILADVTIDAERIINETIDKYNRLDILINNAAFGNHASIETLNIDDFDTMMATNVRSVIQLTQLAIPHLVQSKGNIVNVSSIAGIASFQNFLIYSMSKAALDKVHIFFIGKNSFLIYFEFSLRHAWLWNWRVKMCGLIV